MKKRSLPLIASFLLAVSVLMSGCSADRIADLCEAIKEGDNEEAVKIAEDVKDLNAESSAFPRLAEKLEAEVTTPLVKACETGNAEMILWLLEHGARTDYAPGYTLYPLESFCDTGSGAGAEALQKLLDDGADPNQYKNRPPLFRLAGTLKHRSEETIPAGIEMTMMLIDAGAEWQDPTDGYTILHYAAIQKDGALMQRLLERQEASAFIETKNDDGKTPADLAEESGNAEGLALLRSMT